ncbi:Glutamyl-tRNA(Gln) amidotransferase subunit A [Rickettsiales bacterium Ac37b]|nr:Glutamyl-tRNA(Gln) amidotransferase subunit A [Rickettsiales bacterium Ac37b]
MIKLYTLNIKETIEHLKKKDFTALELMESHIQAMEQSKNLNAFITNNYEASIDAAKVADNRIKDGSARVLEGIPLAIKDNFCTKDILTTAASKMLYNFVPTYESTVTSKLWAEGAILTGKTNMDEFAMGSSGLTSHYGPTKNPWKALGSDKDLVPGGSSSGSAAAVAAYLSMGALGTDTGGSIRQPASYCGVVGMKPSYGRCSRYGMISFASSLDQAGVYARTVDDCALLLTHIMGHDAKDSTSVNIALPDITNLNVRDLKGIKVGIPKEYNVEGLDNEISALWNKGAEWLKEQGAEIIDISLSHTKYALPVYYILAPAEASSNLSRYDGVRFGLRETGKTLDEMYELTRKNGFGKEVKRRIMIGTYVLSAGFYDAYYRKAQKVRSLVAHDFWNSFSKVDVILAPTAPSTAFPLDIKITNPVTMYLNDVFTIPASLAGLPCISVPAGLSKNRLPLGLQLIGNNYDELTVLKVAKALENAADFKGYKG